MDQEEVCSKCAHGADPSALAQARRKSVRRQLPAPQRLSLPTSPANAPTPIYSGPDAFLWPNAPPHLNRAASPKEHSLWLRSLLDTLFRKRVRNSDWLHERWVRHLEGQ